ncbi:cuticle protein 7-like [Danaus plexippus]|uniref:cuticle protein 7-like n=1 Tax=Danaus plexippus TaxID=13037 RepID=UPI002AB1F9BA|nr:cuticle protein 7-like [Danaus plexippus]
MYFKVLCCLVVIAATWAHEHKDAYSSVHITKSDDHPEVIRHRHQDHHVDHDDHIDYYTYPKFQYEYKVKDPYTGDIKSEHVIRDGDHVKGHYSLHQPDGLERVVHFYSDDKTGFHADVKYNTHHHVPVYKHDHH